MNKSWKITVKRTIEFERISQANTLVPSWQAQTLVTPIQPQPGPYATYCPRHQALNSYSGWYIYKMKPFWSKLLLHWALIKVLANSCSVMYNTNILFHLFGGDMSPNLPSHAFVSTHNWWSCEFTFWNR